MEPVVDAYIGCVLKELDYYIKKFSPEFDTLFIGGGTPSSLTAGQLKTLFEGIYMRAPRERFREITVEVNPETLTAEKAVLLSKNITRISIGAQSFSDDNLKLLGRIHNAEKITQAVDLAREAGIRELNLDLMFGIPGQKTGDVIADVEKAMEHSPEHISFYMLTAYEHTPFYKRIRSGELRLPDGEQASDMYRMGIGFLEAGGYELYEISNFARDGKICVHNMNYWDCGRYIGLGASAASFFDGKRYVNVHDVNEYIRLVGEDGDPAGQVEEYTDEMMLKEFIMLGLRKRTGIDLAAFKGRFGFDFSDRYSNIIEKYLESGHLERDAEHVSLTPLGFMVSNTIISEFF
jgi:oxygen-independent coproporphyrinogen-3 oxidase